MKNKFISITSIVTLIFLLLILYSYFGDGSGKAVDPSIELRNDILHFRSIAEKEQKNINISFTQNELESFYSIVGDGREIKKYYLVGFQLDMGNDNTNQPIIILKSDGDIYSPMSKFIFSEMIAPENVSMVIVESNSVTVRCLTYP